MGQPCTEDYLFIYLPRGAPAGPRWLVFFVCGITSNFTSHPMKLCPLLRLWPQISYHFPALDLQPTLFGGWAVGRQEGQEE